jgi:uncharacterized protein DUF1353
MPMEEISGFGPDAKVVVEQVTDAEWNVRQAITYHGKYEPFIVDVGSETDFASVPRVFVWFLPRYGRYTLAAILHDYLWRHRASTGQMDYIDADGTFRRAMRELGVPFLRRWIMWAAVRWGALFKPRGRKGWWRESWRVLLITLFALPFALPAAVVIAVSIALFQLVEFVFFVPLKAHEKVKERAQKHDPDVEVKQVNAPDIDWRS